MSGRQDAEWPVAICHIVIINDAIDMLHMKDFVQVKIHRSAFRVSFDDL